MLMLFIGILSVIGVAILLFWGFSGDWAMNAIAFFSMLIFFLLGLCIGMAC